MPADAEGSIGSSTLGDRLKRIPDGETGPRSDWILWQYPVFSALPQFEVGPPGTDTYRTLPKLRLRPGHRMLDASAPTDNLRTRRRPVKHGGDSSGASQFVTVSLLVRAGMRP